MIKPLILTALIPVGLTLSACSDAPETPIAQMSCIELAREIGRAQERRADSDIDTVAGTLGAAFSNDKTDKAVYGIQGALGGLSGAMARDRLDKLNAAFAQRACH